MTRHRLGFAVKVLGAGGLPSHDTRRWQSQPHLRVSIGHLRAVFDRLDSIDVRMYRMATALAPYASHPDLPQFHGQVEECADELAALGARARELGIRLSTHPGQYTVLNSVEEHVQTAAVADLDVQAALLDALGAGPEAVVVLHVGGSAGRDDGRTGPLRQRLRAADRARPGAPGGGERRPLVLASSTSSEVHDRLGVPVVWDALHHHCHDPAGVPTDEALELALATWPPGATPKIHYSSPRLSLTTRPLQLRAHADLIDPMGFEQFLRTIASRVGRDFDVMLEAKGKDIALLLLREHLRRRIGWREGALEVGMEPCAGPRRISLRSFPCTGGDVAGATLGSIAQMNV